MIIVKSESAGYFTFQVEERDWRSYKVQDFLEEVKSAIPSGFRSYDPETFIWTIKWGGGMYFGKSEKSILRTKIKPNSLIRKEDKMAKIPEEIREKIGAFFVNQFGDADEWFPFDDWSEDVLELEKHLLSFGYEIHPVQSDKIEMTKEQLEKLFEIGEGFGREGRVLMGFQFHSILEQILKQENPDD